MSTSFARYVSVLLDIAVNKTLDYGVTDQHLDTIQKGARISVPVRGRTRYGYIVDIKDNTDCTTVKPITAVHTEELITEELFSLALWMSRYYATPLHNIIKAFIPAAVRGLKSHKQQLFVTRKKSRPQLAEYCRSIRQSLQSQATVIDTMLKVTKGIFLSELLEITGVSRSPITTLVKKGMLEIKDVHVDRSPLDDAEYFIGKSKTLNVEQAEALSRISQTIQSNTFHTHLLYGVTGSGKTEIYLQAIQQAVDQGKGAIILVPEISLTAQTIERFRCRFKDKIAILHHRLSEGERFDEWHRIRRGEAKIVIGARSAIFCPVSTLGLIILDEEHEKSYKQEDELPCYHAREVALMRASIASAAVILGSATPSLESYHNAVTGKYILHTLPSRIADVSHPKCHIVDMKRELEKKSYPFSTLLLDKLRHCQSNGEKAIIFLNRRGYHTSQLCKACGEAITCTACDVSMTYHRSANTLVCHLCGLTYTPPPQQCPSCKSYAAFKFRGLGTEQVEKVLHAILPDIRTIRVDADTTRHKGSHQRLLRDFRSGKADVLIGTQMISKGLHLPEVTLVGIVNSDGTLNIPDFRASETTFQLITQVSGRAGRGHLPGEIVIQTFLPNNDVIKLAAKQEYTTFYHHEIVQRQQFFYPPFSKMVKVAFVSTKEQDAKQYAEHFRTTLLNSLPPSYKIHPAIPAGHAKLHGNYRFHTLVRGESIYTINTAIHNTRETTPPPRNVSLRITVSPLSTFF